MVNALQAAQEAAERFEKGTGGPSWDQTHLMAGIMYALIAIAQDKHKTLDVLRQDVERRVQFDERLLATYRMQMRLAGQRPSEKDLADMEMQYGR